MPHRGKDRHPIPSESVRVVIGTVTPELDCGRYPVKRVVGDDLVVEADLLVDGTESIGGALLWRHEDDGSWSEVRLEPIGNDRFRGRFRLDRLGRFTYRIEAWLEPFEAWRRGLERKIEAGQDVAVDLQIGAEILEAAASRAPGEEREILSETARQLRTPFHEQEECARLALDGRIAQVVARHPDRTRSARSAGELTVVVDRERARFSSWYEFFPRSFGRRGEHGTFGDAKSMLAYVARMGFDVVYLPPIHPIGITHRKGRNNALDCRVGDPGSPWAIGSSDGGHTTVHPQLGSIDDFVEFRKHAESLGMEVALDIAFQVSPDHPWVSEHPQWFRTRPDGTIQYAENPPKKYQDIYPFDFESPDRTGLWRALRDVFLFWIDHGVEIFRVDNPHTKALPFWEWCLREIKERHRGVLFLSEAFTRPKIMYVLAKMGFSQSYTYFTWRNTSHELRDYLHELTHGPVAEFFRPNFWPNTPDILPEHLQHGGRPAFLARLVLAATSSGNYGIYGPAFESMDHIARAGSEEYVDNEKYQLKQWDLDRPDSLGHVVTRLNRIRRENPALQRNEGFASHRCDNDRLLCYSKRDAVRDNVVLIVVCLDHHQRQSGMVHLDLAALGLSDHAAFEVHDLLGDGRWDWQGSTNYVELDPHVMPAHVFLVRARGGGGAVMPVVAEERGE